MYQRRKDKYLFLRNVGGFQSPKENQKGLGQWWVKV